LEDVNHWSIGLAMRNNCSHPWHNLLAGFDVMSDLQRTGRARGVCDCEQLQLVAQTSLLATQLPSELIKTFTGFLVV
jgi:hypothetical protein